MTDPVPRNDLRFTPEMLARPRTGGIDAVSGLEHFAIVTYAIDPERLRTHVDAHFDLDCIEVDGRRKALVSAVPFIDRDFRFARMPIPRFRFGQTNYRAYVIDRASGERLVWFFGTTLDSWTVALPHYAWKLPWHRARMRFDCLYDVANARYSRYVLDARSDWAPMHLELEDSGEPVAELTGFGDLESAQVTLTHPLRGAFFRRDGKLGGYNVWHDRLRPTRGKVLSADIRLFERLSLVSREEQQNPHSVMMQRLTEFTIYLPPKRL
ncbi:MAG: DUF2071 domain-containing protein [bacterium]